MNERYDVVPVEIKGREYFLIWDSIRLQIVGRLYKDKENAERRAKRLNAGED